MPRYSIILSFSILFSYFNSALAIDKERGQDLHDSNCIRCHAAIYGEKGNEIYTRVNKKIDTLTMLETQLNRCKDSLGTDWPKDQIQDVLHYLNSEFYHFEEDE